MKIPFLGVAVISFLLGAIAIYAYNNKNRFVDLLLAASAAFVFGVSMLLAGIAGALRLALVLRLLSEFLIIVAAVFLGIRLFSGLMAKIRGATKNGNDNQNENK
jgi:large-conductance mechanosensitive channel